MKVTLDILLLLICLIIAFQDLKDRLISVFFLGLASLVLVTEFVLYALSESSLSILLSNYLFIIGQLAFLYLYFVHLRKINRSFFDQVIGWGDIIMILCMALAFPLPQLILYLLVSYLSGILFAVFSKPGKKRRNIPLAGLMALVYLFNLGVFYMTGYSLIETFTA